MQNEPTIQDVLEAIQTFSGSVDKRFEAADRKSDILQGEIREVKREISEVKSDLEHMKNDIVTEIDRFVTLHQTLDVEIVSLRSKCDRMESFIVKAAKQLNIEYVSS